MIPASLPSTKTAEIRITKPCVHDNLMHAKGDLLRVPIQEAERLVASGLAAFTTRVKALVEGVIVNRTVYSKGSVFETSEPTALRLIADGAAQAIDPGQFSVPLPTPRKRDERKATQAPADDTPRVKVRATKDGILVGSHVHTAGDVFEAREDLACRLIAQRAVELAKNAKLSSNGTRYLSGLRSESYRLGQAIPAY
jgi:hypothetical protein